MLQNLLANSRGFEASDSRDKFYALLGLAAEAEDLALYVSYSEPTTCVYQRFARWLVEKDEVMDVLYRSGGPRMLLDLLSWILDWGCRGMTPLVLRDWRGSDETDPVYSAWTSSKPEARYHDQRLTLPGVIIDKILEVGHPRER